MKNYTNIMLDTETLATVPGAKVLSISAVAFDPFDNDPDYSQYPILDLLLNMDDQENRIENSDTLDWWAHREPAVIEKMFGEENRVPVKDALSQLAKFAWNKHRLWAQGINFDFPLLEDLYIENSMGIPWEYWKIRDSRTIFDMVAVTPRETSHDSLQDCFDQVIKLQEALKKLGIKKFIR